MRKKLAPILSLVVILNLALTACEPVPLPAESIITPQPSQVPDMPGSSGEVRAEGSTTIAGKPTMQLTDGRTVLLQAVEDQRVPSWFIPKEPKEPREPVEPRRICSRPPFPTSVNLQANQTPVRDQGGRNTCTVFAFTAALEAAYYRVYGLTLDLSEQYLNHVQKSHWLNFGAVTPFVEIQPETNGGGNLPWHTGVLERYGLPEESALPYIGSGDYENTNQPGDQPSGLDSPNLTQRELDDFNLSSTMAKYAIPRPLTTIVFPQKALEGARYRPTQVSFASGSDLQTLDWYKSQLACGREVMFQVNLTSTSYWDANNVWVPGNGGTNGFSHAMLLVGYDDARDAFLLKNSWGGTALNWFSYDWVRQNLVTVAGVILDVASPGGQFGVWENPQIFLGRWNLDHDGWRGILDIYRLPRPSGSAATDLRVGTYFGPDGVARRVNATIDGNRIEFTIDWNNPNQPFDMMQGLHFTGYIFSWDHSILAGKMLDNRDGNTYGFHAQKSTPWAGTPAAGPLGLDTYVGVWSMEHDGWKGFLTIRNVNPVSRTIDATYQSSNGQQYKVSGHIDQDPRKFTMAISFGNPPQQFSGLLYGHELGLAAGTTTWSGSPFGFAMTRIGDVNSVIPTPTENPFDDLAVCQKKPYLPQCQ